MRRQADLDTSNTTLFVGNLSAAATDSELVQLFHPYGAIAHAHVPPGKGCGFVQFVERSSAETALQALQSMPLHGTSLRLSWGRSANRFARAPSQRLGTYPQTPAMHDHGAPAHPMLASVQRGAHGAIAGGRGGGAYRAQHGAPHGAAGQLPKPGAISPLAGGPTQTPAQAERADQHAQSGRPSTAAQSAGRQVRAAWLA